MVLSEEQLKGLVLANKITDEAGWSGVLEYARSTDKTPSKALVEKGLTTDEDLGALIAQFLKVPYVVLSKTTIPEEVFNSIPDTFARKQKVIVFGRDAEGLKVAMARPSKTNLLEILAKKTGQKVQVYYATPTDIDNTLRLYKQDLQMAVDNLLKEDISRPDRTLADDPPVVKIVDLLVRTAYDSRSSDVHIEPQEGNMSVRFRIDGLMHEVLRVQKTLHDRVITRIKVLSNLRTDEHLSAQDGKMRMEMEEERLDIRVSIVPIADGEKAVLRLLSSHQQELTLKDLGMNDQDLLKVSKAYNRSYGMILSTGPTGSGKTTSIYSILKELNKPDRNITTIEDPVEYRIKGANQIQVNVKTNLTFANGLRSILRQDPNIIFVGEIRDDETAGIAVNAALTGHLVLSTLHTNDAATALPRLTDMKVEPFLVASTVSVIMAQRLVRKVCDKCKVEKLLSRKELEENFPPEVVKRNFGTNNEIKFYEAKGCKSCHNTGYSGRVGLFEVLEMTPAIKKLVVEKKDSDTLTKAAVEEGMKTMYDDGIAKMLAGATTLEEVLRVTKAESA
jgi:type IV pilus assembly protein PilB